MLILHGAAALSAFRLDKLAQKLSELHPEIRLRHTRYLHFAQLRAPLSPEQEDVLQQLLTYGPRDTLGESAGAADDTGLQLVVPRPGTISPWSSKATDIAHHSGLEQVERLERGVGYYLNMPRQLTPEQVAAAIWEQVRDVLD